MQSRSTKDVRSNKGHLITKKQGALMESRAIKGKQNIELKEIVKQQQEQIDTLMKRIHRLEQQLSLENFNLDKSLTDSTQSHTLAGSSAPIIHFVDETPDRVIYFW